VRVREREREVEPTMTTAQEAAGNVVPMLEAGSAFPNPNLVTERGGK